MGTSPPGSSASVARGFVSEARFATAPAQTSAPPPEGHFIAWQRAEGKGVE